MNVYVHPQGFGCKTFIDRTGYEHSATVVIVLREARENPGSMRFFYSCNRGDFCFCRECYYSRGEVMSGASAGSGEVAPDRGIRGQSKSPELRPRGS